MLSIIILLISFISIEKYVVYGSENISNLCHRTIPGQGEWLDHPPYWIPKNCNMPKAIDIFDEDSSKECMKGRTIYTIGNSVGRQMLFGLLEMLGGAYVKRSDQRDLCPKHETTWLSSSSSSSSSLSSSLSSSSL